MIILPEDKNIISLLSSEDAQQVLLALFSESDDMPDLTPLANVVYTAVKSKSDRITERKSKAGKTGGAPKNNQNAQKQAEQADEENTSETTHRTSTVPVPYRTDTIPEDIPPLPPEGENTPPNDKAAQRKAEIKAIWQGHSFSEPLGGAVKSWGEYKREKRQEYKPKGLKSLLTEVQNNAAKYGEGAVIALINESMAANWQGIAWDKLARIPDVRGAPKSSKPPGNSSYDLAELEEMLNRGLG